MNAVYYSDNLVGAVADAPLAARQQPRPVSHRITRVSDAQNDRMLRARFDSAHTTDENRQLWALADGMSADASASPGIRQLLRQRSRYEYHNNGWYQGVVDTIGNYVVGTGPRLQVLTPDKAMNKAVQDAWASWAAEIGLADTLKVMRCGRVYNGESVALLRTNPLLDNPVKLDLFQVECDQLQSPLSGLLPTAYPDQFFDGVVLDRYGRPLEYHILRQHPGAFGAFMGLGTEFDRWPARYVLHDFKRIRPGQQRGVPEATPALQHFAEIRRYGKAVLAAAETAADYAVTISSDAPADTEGDDEQPEAGDSISLRRRMATFLPAGWKAAQMKAEQPTTAYDAFVQTNLAEAARSLNLPLFFVMLDARLANMSAAYVATQPWVKSVQQDRVGYNGHLGRTFGEWLAEARIVPGLLPRDLPAVLPHAWRWPQISNHADPSKVAAGQAQDLDNGTTSVPSICAANGTDWEQVQEEAAKSYGMALDDYRAALRQKAFSIRGNPSPATVDPGQSPPADEPASERVAEEEDAEDDSDDD